MSDSIDNTEVDSVNESEEGKLVPKKAYEGVSKDLHKFKDKYRDAEARATELEVRLKSIEEEKMLEKNQYKELFEQKTEELESLRTAVKTKEEKYLDIAKRSALKSELGNVRNEYLQHANVGDIQLNDDGTVNQDSVRAIANDFREKHAVLIPQKIETSSTSLPPSSDPNIKELTQDELKEKLVKMTTKEKIELLKNLNK